MVLFTARVIYRKHQRKPWDEAWAGHLADRTETSAEAIGTLDSAAFRDSRNATLASSSSELLPAGECGRHPAPRNRRFAAFSAALEAHGKNATVRLTRGRDIDAACGPLLSQT